MQVFVTLLGFCAIALAGTPFQVLSDGNSGTKNGQAPDFSGVRYHASGYLSRGGCSSTASAISTCYTVTLANGTASNIDNKPATPANFPISPNGDAGKFQRSVLLGPTVKVGTGKVAVKRFNFKMQLSTSFTDVPAGFNNSVTIAEVQSVSGGSGGTYFAMLARRTQGEEGGLDLGVQVNTPGAFNSQWSVYPLSMALGKTLTVQITLGTGSLVPDIDYGAVASVKVWDTASKKVLMQVGVTPTGTSNGIVGVGSVDGYRLVLGAQRMASSGTKAFKGWFGDYYDEWILKPTPFS